LDREHKVIKKKEPGVKKTLPIEDLRVKSVTECDRSGKAKV
jgi:hypothetical protein